MLLSLIACFPTSVCVRTVYSSVTDVDTILQAKKAEQARLEMEEIERSEKRKKKLQQQQELELVSFLCL